MRRAVVTGAGGFVGMCLVERLKQEGWYVTGIDLKRPEFDCAQSDEFYLHDLREPWTFRDDVDVVFHLAADVGGIGYTSGNFAQIATNNALIDAHVFGKAHAAGVGRLFYASTACVYPESLQLDPDSPPLREQDAIGIPPRAGYDFEKLFGERLAAYYALEGLETRVGRFFTVYGSRQARTEDKEKAPGAICRKVAQAAEGGSIEVWGDGKQTRSFIHVRDACEAIVRIVESDCPDPINIGSTELVSIDDLIGIVCEVAGKCVTPAYRLDRPVGVRGRQPDITKLQHVTGWSPETSLREGIEELYAWSEAIYGVKEAV